MVARMHSIRCCSLVAQPPSVFIFLHASRAFQSLSLGFDQEMILAPVFSGWCPIDNLLVSISILIPTRASDSNAKLGQLGPWSLRRGAGQGWQSLSPRWEAGGNAPDNRGCP